MKVLVDLNIHLDVVQNRVPHYLDSAEVLSRALTGELQAFSGWVPRSGFRVPI